MIGAYRDKANCSATEVLAVNPFALANRCAASGV